MERSLYDMAEKRGQGGSVNDGKIKLVWISLGKIYTMYITLGI